jgi:hypothetical protein
VVPPRGVGLDSPATRLPPLTSFTGFRSRIMASLMSFLTRRQADRTIFMFGICLFILNGLPKLSRSDVLATTPSRSKPKKCLIAFVTWCECSGHHFLIRPWGVRFDHVAGAWILKRGRAISKAALTRPNKSSPSRIHSDTGSRYEQKYLLHNWSNCRYRNRAKTARCILGISLLVSSCCPKNVRC